MTLSPKTRVDIKELLVSIHLDMYYPYFQRAGYITVCNCEEINNEVLQKIGIPLTGHRKRILKQLEFSFADIEAEPSTSEHKTTKSQPGAKTNENVFSGNKDSSKENENTYNMEESAHIFNEKSSEICENKDLRSMTKDSLKHKDNLCSDVDNLSSTGSRSMGLPSNTVLVEKSNPLNTANLGSNNDVSKRQDGHDKEEQYCSYSLATLPSTQSSDNSATTHEVPDENENMAFQEADSPAEETFFEFQGEMVINDIYDEMKTFSKTKTTKQNAVPSRSFILRNRPVPEIPGTSDSAPPVSIPSTSVGIARLHSDESLYAAAEYKSSDESSHDSSTFYEDFGTEFTQDEIGKTKEREGPYRISWQCMIGIYNDLSEMSKPPQRFAPESEYSTAVELARNLTVPNMEPFKSHSFPRTLNNQRNMLSYSSLSDGIDDVTENQNLLSRDNPSITPYACFYGSSSKREKTGWLDKLSPQGNYMFQKRWVKFDGVTLSYYNNEKEVYSKGIIPVHAIKSVYPHGDSKFEVLTSQRKFVFRVEKEGDRNDWVSTLQNALKYHANAVPATAAAPDKSGYLDMKGSKGKTYAALSKNTVVLCKNEQDYKAGLAITNIPMNVANIKHMDRKGFEITTPFKSFSFTAESEREKQEWIEVVQESIADTLSDYEVAEKIWFNESNRNCADCQATDPDWASINLCVVICKNCAGPHRSLGSKLSKVRSLKLDASVWSNELVELFIVVGNKKANSFWAANLPTGKQLQMDSPQEQRQSFIVQKYKEGRFKKHLSCVSQQQLNEALCAAVVKVDLLETMSLVFSGADAMCATGDPTHSTPYLLAKKAGQCLQMEFLHHNKFSDYPKCDPGAEIGLLPDSSLSAFLCGFLYKAPSAAKPGPEKKLKEDLNRRWCTMEGGFLSYYENDKTATPNGMIDLHEVISLVVHKAACYLNLGAIFTFEIYLLSERVFLFGAETVESQREWTQAVAKYFVPAVGGYLTERDYDLVGHMYYKDCHSLDQWKTCRFALEKSYLHYCPVEDNTKGDKIHLRRLQELTASTFIQNGNKIDVLLLVEQGRTLYIHGHSRLDFMAWNSAIEKAAGTDGNALQDQQLGKNDVPITVISCIAFVTQYGLGSKSLYLTNGNPVSVRELVEQFKKDARSVKLRVGQHQLEDVTEVLKCFLSEIDDALLTKELYPYWISVLDVQDEKLRVDKYGTLIQSLPPINRATLAALMEHLYRVCKCSEINCLDTHNLAMAFSSCLFQTEGQNGEEVSVIEDLINNYVQLFQVKEDQVKQMDIENNCITKWKDTQFSLEEDVLIDIYVEKKESECCVLIKVSPTMEADELTKIVLRLKNITPSTNDIWATFEVIKNGELERPLHYREKVLDAVLQWSSLSEPESAYLIAKRFQFMDAFKAPMEKPAADIIKAGNLKFKEEPSKLLSGNKFQERYFVLQDGKLSLYKDMKNSKPEKFLSLSSSKFYLGVKKKSKSPPSWGFTALCEKHQWLLSCDAQETQMEWFISILMAQHGNDIWPAATKQLQVEGNASTFIQHGGSHVKMRKKSTECTDPQTGNQHPGANDAEGESIVKQRASLIAHCLERKDDKVRSQAKKHRSMVGLDDTNTQGGKLQPTTAGDSKSQKKKEDKPAEVPMVIHKLPTNLMKELNSVLLKNRAHMEAP